MDTTTLDYSKARNGDVSISLGVHSYAYSDLSTAIGASVRTHAVGAIALGAGADASRQNSVAIGTGSTTDVKDSRQLSVSYDSNGTIVAETDPNAKITFNWAGGTNITEGDIVSFGSEGVERQLKNVAAGR